MEQPELRGEASVMEQARQLRELHYEKAWLDQQLQEKTGELDGRRREVEQLKVTLVEALSYRKKCVAAVKECEGLKMRVEALKTNRVAAEKIAAREAERHAVALAAAVVSAEQRATVAAAEAAIAGQQHHEGTAGEAAAAECRRLRRQLQEEQARFAAERDALQAECRRLREQARSQMPPEQHQELDQLQHLQRQRPTQHAEQKQPQRRQPAQHASAATTRLHAAPSAQPQPQLRPAEEPRSTPRGSHSADSADAVCPPRCSSPAAEPSTRPSSPLLPDGRRPSDPARQSTPDRQRPALLPEERTPTSRPRPPPDPANIQLSASTACRTLSMHAVMQKAAAVQAQTPAAAQPGQGWRQRQQPRVQEQAAPMDSKPPTSSPPPTERRPVHLLRRQPEGGGVPGSPATPTSKIQAGCNGVQRTAPDTVSCFTKADRREPPPVADARAHTAVAAAAPAPAQPSTEAVTAPAPAVPAGAPASPLHSVTNTLAQEQEPPGQSAHSAPPASRTQPPAAAAKPAVAAAAQQPNPAAAQPGEPDYKYRETVRGKRARELLPGVDCQDCRKWYAALQSWGAPEGARPACGHCPQEQAIPAAAEAKQQQPGVARMRQENSRHRYRNPPPQTQPGFWDLRFPGSEETAI